jgi:methanogenic corrinoid protein MtbC1
MAVHNGAQHSIKLVSRITGLSAHVIRVWEKRYAAVTPARTGTRRRLFSDDDVERLNLLHQAILAGHTIGNVANLPTMRLREIVGVALIPDRGATLKGPDGNHAEHLLNSSARAVARLDRPGLENTLNQASVVLGYQGLLQKVIGPLAHIVGDLWRQGTISAAHEHFATAVIRDFLARAAKPYPHGDHSPRLVVATPAGQVHELGATIVAAAAANLGWRATYLGSSLPAAEIAGAAIQDRALAVALSLVYPEDDPALASELDALRRYLPTEVRILAGGRAALAYATALRRVGATLALSLNDLYGFLDHIQADQRSRAQS